MVAPYAHEAVRIDGVLDDAVWQTATAYPMCLSTDQSGKGKEVQEGGTVRLAWDSNNVYLAVAFTDSDVVAEGDKDGLHHYQLGDLAELFLWPEDQTWYVEMYVTPRGNFTSFFFPSGGRGLPSTTASNAFPLRVAAKVDGTLNDWSDRDRQWTGEMAVPVSELTARGARVGPGTAWRVLVGRYNYSRWLFTSELTETPALPATNYHLRRDYGRLLFLAPSP
jgi:hypothetical protein